jgi:hypothetical protein
MVGEERRGTSQAEEQLVRGERLAYIAVYSRDDNGANHHQPVCHRNVYLSVELPRGVY